MSLGFPRPAPGPAREPAGAGPVHAEEETRIGDRAPPGCLPQHPCPGAACTPSRVRPVSARSLGGGPRRTHRNPGEEDYAVHRPGRGAEEHARVAEEVRGPLAQAAGHPDVVDAQEAAAGEGQAPAALEVAHRGAGRGSRCAAAPPGAGAWRRAPGSWPRDRARRRSAQHPPGLSPDLPPRSSRRDDSGQDGTYSRAGPAQKGAGHRPPASAEGRARGGVGERGGGRGRRGAGEGRSSRAGVGKRGWGSLEGGRRAREEVAGRWRKKFSRPKRRWVSVGVLEREALFRFFPSFESAGSKQLPT